MTFRKSTVVTLAMMAFALMGMARVAQATPPAQVTNVAANYYWAAPTQHKIQVSWSAAQGATSYLIYRADMNINNYVFVTQVTSLSYLDGPLSLGHHYFYNVIGYNGQGSIPSVWADEWVPSPDPTNFSGYSWFNGYNRVVTLNWSCASFPTGAFRIFWSTDQTNWTQFVDQPDYSCRTMTYDEGFNHLPPGVVYFVIWSINDPSDGYWSLNYATTSVTM